MREALRSLPSVDQILRKLTDLELPQSLITRQVRAVIEERRDTLLNGRDLPGVTSGVNNELTIEDAVRQRCRALLAQSLHRVINATGIILHTNLGRAPLPESPAMRGYSNLEYDLATGKRGKRDQHASGLIEELLHHPGIVVNNNAAAVFLVLNELAAGHEVIVSRGELIEIGDGFRIPEIMASSGAVLREVGTTNRTRAGDYAAAINERTRLILRVHPSNFRMSGFTERPGLPDLVELGRERGVPVYEDLGSGCLIDLSAQGIDEPLVGDSLSAGVNLVSFSGDKLLGGPQSGIIAGDPDLVSRVRRNPMYRALRVDKLILNALETTLRHLVTRNLDAIPALRMIVTAPDQLRQRAGRVAEALALSVPAVVKQSESAIGGGSTPDQTLPSWVVELNVRSAAGFERSLRQAATPVIVRIEREKIILDMRTVADEEESLLIDAVVAAARSQAS